MSVKHNKNVTNENMTNENLGRFLLLRVTI